MSIRFKHTDPSQNVNRDKKKKKKDSKVIDMEMNSQFELAFWTPENARIKIYFMWAMKSYLSIIPYRNIMTTVFIGVVNVINYDNIEAIFADN